VRIKPNLLKGASGSFHVKNGPSDNWGSKSFVLPKLKDGEKYTVSFKVRNQNDIARNVVGVVLSNMAGDNDYVRFNISRVSDTASQTFIYKEGRSEKIFLYPGTAGAAHNCEATFYNIKLIEGESTDLYLPNVNDLEPSKQAIFKAGGGIPRGVSTLLGLGVGYAS